MNQNGNKESLCNAFGVEFITLSAAAERDFVPSALRLRPNGLQLLAGRYF